MSALDDEIVALTAQVARAKGVEASATVYINAVPGLIQKAKDDAAAAGATPAQLQSLTDLGTSLDAASGDLQTALSANP